MAPRKVGITFYMRVTVCLSNSGVSSSFFGFAEEGRFESSGITKEETYKVSLELSGLIEIVSLPLPVLLGTETTYFLRS